MRNKRNMPGRCLSVLDLCSGLTGLSGGGVCLGALGEDLVDDQANHQRPKGGSDAKEADAKDADAKDADAGDGGHKGNQRRLAVLAVRQRMRQAIADGRQQGMARDRRDQCFWGDQEQADHGGTAQTDQTDQAMQQAGGGAGKVAGFCIVVRLGASTDGVTEEVFVLTGEMEVLRDGDWVSLSAGQGLRFAADQPHGYRSARTGAAFLNMHHYRHAVLARQNL